MGKIQGRKLCVPAIQIIKLGERRQIQRSNLSICLPAVLIDAPTAQEPLQVHEILNAFQCVDLLGFNLDLDDRPGLGQRDFRIAVGIEVRNQIALENRVW